MNKRLKDEINGLIDYQVESGQLEKDVIDDIVKYLTKHYEYKNELKELNSVIQQCPYCGKVDAYKNDGHSCNRAYQQIENGEYYD